MRMPLTLTSLFAASAALMGGAFHDPSALAKKREKKRRYGKRGTAFSKGKKSRSLKMRANRRKAKTKVRP